MDWLRRANHLAPRSAENQKSPAMHADVAIEVGRHICGRFVDADKLSIIDVLSAMGATMLIVLPLCLEIISILLATTGAMTRSYYVFCA